MQAKGGGEETINPQGMSLSKALSLASAWLDGGENPPPPQLFDNAAISDNNSSGRRSISDDDDDDVGPTATTTPRLTGSTTVNPIERAISLLLEIQTQMESRSINISNNESLEDVSTPSLELMSVPYHLARAYLMLPTTTTTTTDTTCKNYDNDSDNNNNYGDNHNPSSSSSSQVVQIMVGGNSNPSLVRKHNVTQAMEYFHSFLKRLDQLSGGSNKNHGILSEGTLKEYHALLDDCGQQQDEDEQDQQGYNHRSPPPLLDPNRIRTMKIQRYQRKKNAQTQKQQLTSLIQRRSRLGLSDNEYLDDHDQESLLRSLHMETLRVYAEEALEEISASMRELEMIELSIKYDCNDGSAGNNMASRSGNPKGSGRAIRDGRVSSSSATASHHSRPTDAPPPVRSLQMTQITQNPITGQLQLAKQQVTNGGRSHSSATTQILQRQQIKEGVFRPGWNLPTMSLEELANREIYEAMRRSEAHKIAEAEAIYKPRRYDQLERDGMEDDANLVEASAQLDREWDSWKEENPRGCGNKLGERGDRNF